MRHFCRDGNREWATLGFNRDDLEKTTEAKPRKGISLKP